MQLVIYARIFCLVIFSFQLPNARNVLLCRQYPNDDEILKRMLESPGTFWEESPVTENMDEDFYI